MPRPTGYQIDADAFNDLRLRQGTSQAAVARAAGLAPSTLSGIINGTSRASLDAATSIARVFGCRPGTLFADLHTGPRLLTRDVTDDSVA